MPLWIARCVKNDVGDSFGEPWLVKRLSGTVGVSIGFEGYGVYVGRKMVGYADELIHIPRKWNLDDPNLGILVPRRGASDGWKRA